MITTGLGFWFSETKSEQWFKKDEHFDATVRSRFLALNEALAAQPSMRSSPTRAGRSRQSSCSTRCRATCSGEMRVPSRSTRGRLALARRLLRGAMTRTDEG